MPLVSTELSCDPLRCVMVVVAVALCQPEREGGECRAAGRVGHPTCRYFRYETSILHCITHPSDRAARRPAYLDRDPREVIRDRLVLH